MFTEDFTPFFDTDDFAVEFVFDGVTVDGIFDREYVSVEDIDGYKPVFICPTSDVVTVGNGSICTSGGLTYTVLSTQPDGTGVTTLVLEKA